MQLFLELNTNTVKERINQSALRYRLAKRARRPKTPMGTKATREQILESPLLFDEKRFWRWACKMYGRTFMSWVRQNWVTASEREVQVMHRAWIAAGGAPD